MEAILGPTLANAMSAVTLAKAGGAAAYGSLSGLASAGLSLPSSTALGSAAWTTAGSILGSLKASYLLGSPAVALTACPAGAKAVGAIIGGAMAVGTVPVLLSTLGFTGTGIAASSIAAKLMSVSAIANGGGIASGSLVATLQSMGAGGLSMPSKVILSSVGSVLGSLIL